MEIVGLEDSLRSRYPAELSGKIIAKLEYFNPLGSVGIARALATSPDILLMDERLEDCEYSGADGLVSLRLLHSL